MSKSARRARNTRILVIVSLIVGFVAGFACSQLLNKSNASDRQMLNVEVNPATEAPAEDALPPLSFDEEDLTLEPDENEHADSEEEFEELSTELPTEVPTAEPTEAPTPEPTEKPAPIQSRLNAGVPAVLSVQLQADGTPRTEAAQELGGSVNVSLNITGLLDPNYFRAQYGETAQLMGNESAIEIEATLMAGGTIVTANPQELFKEVSVVLANGEVDRGYQLESGPLTAGETPTLTAGTPVVFYKPFDYTTPPQYLRIVNMIDGREQVVDFALPAAKSPYKQLQKGDNNRDVATLQAKLIDMGYLNGKADGQFGAKTEDAVKSAQFRLGLPQTGVADPDFLLALYGNAPATTTTTPVTAATDTAAADTAAAASTAAQPSPDEVADALIAGAGVAMQTAAPTVAPTELPDVVG